MADADWYEKHKTDVAVALKRAKTAAKDEAIYCALARMKDKTDLLCAHINLTKQAAMVKEAKAAKGKVVSAGRLYAGDHGPTFEVSQGDLSIKARFGKAAAVALGSPMNVTVVGVQAPAADGSPPAPAGTGSGAPQAAPAPEADMAAVRAALAKLVPTIQQAAKDHPDKKNELLQPLAQCQQHIKDNKAAEAKAQLAEAVRRVKALGGAPPTVSQGAAAASKPPAAPPTPNGVPPAPPPGMAAVRATLARLTPLVQKAVNGHPERKSDLLASLARSQQQIKDNRPAEAKATLLEIGRLLKTMGPPARSQAAEDEAAGTADESDQFRAMYDGLLETVPGDLRRLRGVDPVAAEKVQKVVDGAAAFAAKGKFRSAFKYLNQAADVLAISASAARVKEAADVIPEGKVAEMKAALSQSQSKWDAALATVRARLKPIQAALRENFPNAAVGTKNILDSYEQDLLDELQAAARADAEGLAEALQNTLAKVQALRAEAAGDKVFAYLEQCGTPVKAAFAHAFNEIESLLQA